MKPVFGSSQLTCQLTIKLTQIDVCVIFVILEMKVQAKNVILLFAMAVFRKLMACKAANVIME